MRLVGFSLAVIAFTLAPFAASGAQEVSVSVGAVTRYSGIATNQRDVKDIKTINEFLNDVESQLSRAFVDHTEVEYLDRMNTEAIFREIHLSSNAEFDASSGAMRGLLGRLDFLVVIDSDTPSTARIRLLDVQSGAVKAIGSCAQRSWLMSLASRGPLDCITPFVNRSIAVMHAKKTAKIEQAREQVAAEFAAKKQSAMEQKREREQADEEAREAADAAIRARKAAEREAAAQAEISAQLASIHPALDDAISRLSAQKDFWRDFSRQLASAGQSLRPSIVAELAGASRDADNCQQLYEDRRPDELRTCITKLNADLDKLDKLKD